MTFWDFVNQHDDTLVCLLAWGFISLTVVTGFVLRLVSRITRHRNILARGWPPPHCDADGDLRDEE